jgi:hypothetical protein
MTLFDQPNNQMPTTPCPKCQSEHIWKGEIYAHSHWPIFKPGRVRRWHSFLIPSVQMPQTALACLDCGLVWTYASVDELRKVIEKHCQPTNDTPVA